MEMAEYMISLVIYGLISLLLIGIGVSEIRSKKPVGFYTHEKAPRKQDIIDVPAWNKKHGVMWITYGVSLIGVHIICIFIRNAVVAYTLLIGVTIVPLPIAMWYHARLKKRYYR